MNNPQVKSPDTNPDQGDLEAIVLELSRLVKRVHKPCNQSAIRRRVAELERLCITLCINASDI